MIKRSPNKNFQADATEKDQAALETLAEKAAGNPDSPTSNKDSGGGCDAGFGGMALLALLGLIATKKH